MRRAAAVGLVAVFMAAAPTRADPPTIGVPAELRAVGDYARWSPTSATTAKGVSYVGLSGVDAFPSELLKDSRAFVLPVRGLPAGRYKFRAVGSRNDEHVQEEFVVVVGDPPTPPNPIPPTPVPPDPADPLAAAVAAMYGADQSPTKHADARLLAGVYRELAKQAVPALATAGELATATERARRAAVADRLQPIRESFGREFGKVMPTDPAAAMTADLRAAAVREFDRYAAILEGLAK